MKTKNVRRGLSNLRFIVNGVNEFDAFNDEIRRWLYEGELTNDRCYTDRVRKCRADPMVNCTRKHNHLKVITLPLMLAIDKKNKKVKNVFCFPYKLKSFCHQK